MTIRRYVLRARSIDGAVFAVDVGACHGWTTTRKRASRLTLRAAQTLISEQHERNSRAEPDGVIGRLSIEPATMGKNHA